MTPLHHLDHHAAGRGADLGVRVRDADPLSHRPGATAAGEDERLLALRARVEHRLRTEPTTPVLRAAPAQGRGPRRWQQPRLAAGVVLALGASALLTVGVLAPQILSATPQPPLDAATVSQDGQISCGTGGYAAAIPPAQAPVRLLPSELAPSWSISGVRARSSTSDGACRMPSIQALATDPQGVVTATVSVVGPVHVDLGKGSLGTAAAASVDGHDARLFDLTDTTGGADSEAGAAFTRWVWSDGSDQTWMIETAGYDLAGARTVVTGVHTDGDQVTLDTSATPDLEVVHRRTGAPYAGEHASLDWHVALFDGSTERQFDVYSSTDPETTRDQNPTAPQPWLEEYATVGSQRTTIAGYRALVGPTTTEIPPTDGLDANPAPQSPIDQITPVIVQINPTTIAWTLSREDLPAVTTAIASLEDAPRDDPRLKDLDEN